MPDEAIPELPSTVASGESLARYLTHSNHYRSSDKTVSPRAFEPPQKDLRLSVFRIDGLSTEMIWEIGQKNVVDKMPYPRNLYGKARLTVSIVRGVHLDIDPDNSPRRHACIVGWPEGPEQKHRRMSIAQELAAGATLVLRT